MVTTTTVACCSSNINNYNNNNNNNNNNSNNKRHKIECSSSSNFQVSYFSHGTSRTALVFLNRLLLMVVLLSCTSSRVQAAATYQCNFLDKNFTCPVYGATYPCCFNPESSRYYCTDSCGTNGKVFYQPPSSTTPATARNRTYTTTRSYTRYRSTTPWWWNTTPVNSFDIGKISTLLVVVLPLGAVLIVMVAVCTAIGVSWYRRRRRSATSGGSPEDVENRMNDYRYIARRNPPSCHQMATNQQLLPATAASNVPSCPPDEPPPSYELVTGGSSYFS